MKRLVIILFIILSFKTSFAENKEKKCKFIEIKKIENSYTLDYNVKNKEYVVDGIYFGKQPIKNKNYSEIGIFGNGYYLKRIENGKEIFELSDGYNILGDEIEFYISNDKNNFILWKREGDTIDIIKNKKILYSIKNHSFNRKNSIEIGRGGNTIDIVDKKGDIINYNLYGFNSNNERYGIYDYNYIYSDDLNDYIAFKYGEKIFSKNGKLILESTLFSSLSLNQNKLLYTYFKTNEIVKNKTIENKDIKITLSGSLKNYNKKISNEIYTEFNNIFNNIYEINLGNRLVIGDKVIKIDGDLIFYSIFGNDKLIYLYKKGEKYFIVNNLKTEQYSTRILEVFSSNDGKKELKLFMKGKIKVKNEMIEEFSLLLGNNNKYFSYLPETYLEIDGVKLENINNSNILGNFSDDSSEYVFIAEKYNLKEEKKDYFLTKYTCNSQEIFKYQLNKSGEKINLKLKSKIDKIFKKISSKKAELVFNKIQKISKKIRENKKYKNLIDYLESKSYFKINK